VLRAGGTLDVGTLPLTDLSQKAALEAQGYKLATLYVWGVAFIMPNLDNPTVGPMLSQLYIRQALEDLIPRKQIVQKVYHGYASPGNGPVPAKPVNHFDSPLEKSGGPYPYDPAKAKALLTAHGWKVTPGGTDTCQRPGTAANQCGKGITAGEKLALQLSFSSGDSAVKTQQEVVKSSEAKAGISIQLKSEPFSTLVSQVLPCKPGHTSASTCKWQLVDFGYNPYPLYPSGNSFFNTGGAQNTGGYSNPKMDSLINQTQYGSSSKAFYAYENFAARQLPWLWVPDPAFIIVYKANLHGLAPIDPVLGPNNPQDWYYTSKKS
ncbi:MAG: ABC transporter substrate-binding protein, partial [Acidimicrobiales bacterium]